VLLDRELEAPAARRRGRLGRRRVLLRINALLSILASAEDRSQLEIFRDLVQTATEVVRFRLAADEARGGEVPINYGVRLLQPARDSMLAAAGAAVDPRPVYHTRKPALAVNYLPRLKLGQTGAGSYFVTLLSKVPPALHPPANGELFAMPEEPFSRPVVIGLNSALSATTDSAEQVQSRVSLNRFAKRLNPLSAPTYAQWSGSPPATSPSLLRRHAGSRISATS
jgi:hypothetical protein